MASEIKATITVSLGKEASESTSSVSAEIDTRSSEEGGLNAARLGKTDGFEPGDVISVLLYIPTNVVYDPAKYPNECYTKWNLTNHASASFFYTGSFVIIPVVEQLKFDGSSRTANLKHPCYDPNAATIGWVGQNLEQYYGGGIALSGDALSVSLPPVPKSWQPTFADTDSPQTRADKLNAFTKRTREIGILNGKYNTKALVFNMVTPSYAQMEQYGKPPYPVEATIYCKQLT